MKSRSRALLDKSLGAILSAIEVYNKPDFDYREETFSILAVNAWELLLKARILQLDNNRLSSIMVYERRQNADGSISTKLYRKKNRAGNQISIGIFRAYDLLVNDYGDNIDPVVRTNLEVLVEIRDNSVHFINKDLEISKRILEIGTATLKNYLNIVRQWFGLDLSTYNFFIMPLGFFRDFHTAEGVTMNGQERKLLKYVKAMQAAVVEDETNDFNLALEIDIKFKRTSTDSASLVSISNDPNALPIKLEEENIRETYPWDYGILTTRLRKRYTDFKLNHKYHQTRKPLEKDERFCRLRLLDPGNPKSQKKKFYNPNILKEFDHYYNRKRMIR